MKSLVFSSLLVLAVAACTHDSSKGGPPPASPAPQQPQATAPAKQEPAKTDPAKTDPAKQEPANQEPAKQEPAKQEPAKPAAKVADMDADIKKLQAKPEHTAPQIEVQHILISFAGAGTKAKRTKAEAEALAKVVYAEVMAGGDFDALVVKYTDDSPPGKYEMFSGKTGSGRHRSGMVKAFGDVGWRLQVGEIGVAPFDQAASPFGWHIVKRTK